MANHYASGARLERLVKLELEAKGYHVTRSAGSHGAIDLVAINARRIRLIQVKAKGAVRPSDLRALRRLKAPPICTREIWERQRGGTWRVRPV